MKYRPLGKTGISVSEIGFGAYGIGGASIYGKTSDVISLAALRKALDLGINFFDTSPAYGNSEALIGQAIKYAGRDKVIVATKVGWPDFSKPQDFSYEGLAASLETSLANLATDYIDVLQLHDPPQQEIHFLYFIQDVVKRGLVRTWGVSAKSPDDALDFLYAPVIQINLNMLDKRAIDNGLLAKCKEHQIGVIARTPLAKGELVKKYRSALRFCLAQDSIATIIPGIMNAEEAIKNAAIGA
jgi:aryl-alcohol dehydrogenase-like predicted oxidoreductase